MLSLLSAPGLSAEELPTARELQRLYLESNGGLTNLLELSSVIANGEITYSDELPREFKLYRKRPNLLRMQIYRDDSEFIRIYDGNSGHEVTESYTGTNEIGSVEGVGLEQLRLDSEWDGPFFRLRSRPEYLEVVGLVEINGQPAYEIVISEEADSQYERIWLHREHLQELKISRKISVVEGEPVYEEIILSDHEQVRGVWVPKRLSYFYKDQLSHEIVIDRVRANVGLFDSLFQKP